MGEGQVIQGIIGGILAIVGILLAIISSGIWFRRVKIRIGFLGIGLALSGVGLFILITSFPQYAIGFSVLATLALAFAAFLTIKEADAREDRRRKDELAKEKRDREERLLNEIIEWATDAAKCDHDVNISMPTKTDSKVWLKVNLSKILFNYNLVNAKSEYVKGIALAFEEDLQNAVNRVAQGLFDCILAMQNRLDDLDNEDTKKKEKENEKSLKLSVAILIIAAAKIKTRDIGSEEEENMLKEDEDTMSKESTIKGIEDHLKRQDRQMARGTYFSGYLFGATLIFIAFGLLAGKYIFTSEFWYVTYCIVILIGGTGLIGFASYKRSKTPK